MPNKEELFELVVESSIDFAIFTMDPNGLQGDSDGRLKATALQYGSRPVNWKML